MGHRGAAAAAPENTLASIRRAAEEGASWVEFDVMLTGDDCPVLFHDDSLKRTTGRQGLMAETPFDALQDLDAGAWFGKAFKGEPVPTLETALNLARDLGLGVNMEIKPSEGRDVETAKAAVTVLARHQADGLTSIVSSFSRMSLAVALALEPQLPRALISHKRPADWQGILKTLDCTALHINSLALNKRFIGRVKAAGYLMSSYTVNDAARARELRAFGVDCIISDKPGAILKALSA